MANPVAMGAMMTCTMGLTPAPLTVIPKGVPSLGGTLPIATVMDHIPMANIPTFGMCKSLANPAVTAATATALGVLTPMPCIPVTTSPWVPGSPTVLVGTFPMLNNNCKLMCNWAGVIGFTAPNVPTVLVPG